LQTHTGERISIISITGRELVFTSVTETVTRRLQILDRLRHFDRIDPDRADPGVDAGNDRVVGVKQPDRQPRTACFAEQLRGSPPQRQILSI
jgi:hypothetical protein